MTKRHEGGMAQESDGWHTPQWTWSCPGFLVQYVPHPQVPIEAGVGTVE